MEEEAKKLLILKMGRHRVLHKSNLLTNPNSIDFCMNCGMHLKKTLGTDMKLVDKMDKLIKLCPEWRIVEKKVLRTECVELCQGCFPNGIDESDLEDE